MRCSLHDGAGLEVGRTAPAAFLDPHQDFLSVPHVSLSKRRGDMPFNVSANGDGHERNEVDSSENRIKRRIRSQRRAVFWRTEPAQQPPMPPYSANALHHPRS